MNQIGLLVRLYVSPLKTFSRIIDEGRLIFAVIAAFAALLALQIPRTAEYYRQSSETYSRLIKMRMAQGRVNARAKNVVPGLPPAAPSAADEDDNMTDALTPFLPKMAPPSIAESVDSFLARIPTQYFAPLMALAVGFVPAVILVLTMWENLGGFSTILFRDYLALLVCCLLAWSAAYLPLAAANYALYVYHVPAHNHPALWWVAQAYFLALAVLAIRTVFGTRFGHAIGAAGGGWTGAVGGLWLNGIFGGATAFLASPFVLYYLYARLNPEFRSLDMGLRSRQRLKERLDTATLNPRDADAHYQLGLIYQQRRQYEPAMERFRTAISIDPAEAGAHYQLGRIAREQGRFRDALEHYRAAARIDDKHSSSEVWREIGAANLLAGDAEAACAALEKYCSRRPYDPEGGCWYGRALARLGRNAEARAAFEQAIEAVRTMPPARKRQVRQWDSEARRELKKLLA